MDIFCCFISDGGVSCDHLAEYVIDEGPTYMDFTFGCADHVGHLISDGKTACVEHLC